MKVFKFVYDRDNLLKFFVLLLPREESDLSISTHWLVHIVLQQSRTNLSVCSVHYVNHLVSHFELFIHVVGLCCYRHWGKVFFCTKVFCCYERLIPQPPELVEICFSHCEILYQSETFDLIFLEKTLSFFIQLTGTVFAPRKLFKFVLTFTKVHIVGAS